MNFASQDPQAENHSAAPLPGVPLPAASVLSAPRRPRRPVLSLMELVAYQIKVREQKVDMILTMARTKTAGWQAMADVFDAELARLETEIQAERKRQDEQAAEVARTQARAAEIVARGQENLGMCRLGFRGLPFSLHAIAHNSLILHRYLVDLFEFAGQVGTIFWCTSLLLGSDENSRRETKKGTLNSTNAPHCCNRRRKTRTRLHCIANRNDTEPISCGVVARMVR